VTSARDTESTSRGWAVPSNRALLDTSVLVSLLHASDDHHEACREALRGFRGTLFTTEPVLTETVFLLRSLTGGARAAVEFIRRGGAILVPQSHKSLDRAADLIERYGSKRMDLADATLVALAEDMRLRLVLTLDRRDFGVYRVLGRPFDIVP